MSNQSQPFYVPQIEEEKIDPVLKAPELYAALKDNNEPKIFALLNEGVPPTYHDKETGFDALYWAVKHNKPKIVKLLLENGGSAHYKHVRKLVDIDSNIHNLDSLSVKTFNNSPLLLASYSGNINIMWMLLADGFSPDDYDVLGNTALHLAAAGGRTQSIKVLLACGANLLLFNKFRNRPVHVTINHVDHDLIVAETEKRNAVHNYNAEVAKTDILRKVNNLGN